MNAAEMTKERVECLQFVCTIAVPLAALLFGFPLVVAWGVAKQFGYL